MTTMGIERGKVYRLVLRHDPDCPVLAGCGEASCSCKVVEVAIEPLKRGEDIVARPVADEG